MKTAVTKNLIPVIPNELDNISSIQKSHIASGFIPPHLDKDGGIGYIAETATTLDTAGNRVGHYGSIYTKTLASAISGDANEIYLGSNDPLVVNVNGYKIKLESSPAKLTPMVITLPAAPDSGSRQDMVVLEVWKEEVKLAVSNDAFFPYGNVQYSASGTFDGCTLSNTNHTGGEWPLYLATSSEHGYYVTSNDVNIKTFMANPDNNVGLNSDGTYYQLRWRIVTLSDVRPQLNVGGFIIDYAGTGYFRSQGQKATRPAKGSATGSDGIIYGQSGADVARSTLIDSGLYLGGVYTSANAHLGTISGISLDGFVYVIPICSVNRRNTTAWSLSNINGAGAIGGTSGRPDSKFYDHIHKDDILDLRHRVTNDFNMKDLYEENIQQLLKADLTSNIEELKTDADGNGVYDSTNIYGTNLLRAEGINASAWTSAYMITRVATCNNTVKSDPDGLRNYFSDVEGEQAIFGRIDNENNASVNPSGIFSYTASTHLLVMNLVNQLVANDGSNSNRPQFSGRMPDLYWSGNNNESTMVGKGTKTYIVDTVLTGDTSTALIKRETSVKIIVSGSDNACAADDIYSSPNATSVALKGKSWNGATLAFSGIFTGTTIPDTGTWTKLSGSGPASMTVTSVVVGYRYDNFWSNISILDYVGEGYDLHDAEAIFINAYVKFTNGSGFLTRIPYDNGDSYEGLSSIKACHWYVGGFQKLPSSGVDFYPFGAPVDPQLTNAGTSDAHTKSTSMMGFMKKTSVIPVSSQGTYDTTSAAPGSIIKDGSYKMWYVGTVGSNTYILYATSTDGISWSNFQPCYKYGTVNAGLVGAQGTYDTSRTGAPYVIKDGSTYKMWYMGYNGSNWRIIYCDSSDGITWTNFALAINTGSEGTYDQAGALYPCVIKDGSTYKMWYTGYYSGYYIIYADSADGTTWTNFKMILNNTGFPILNTTHSRSACVIKDNTIYKMWYEGYDGSVYKVLYCVSLDGKNWSRPIVFINDDVLQSGVSSIDLLRIIKDDYLYKGWLQAGTGINHCVLTMLDTSNSGSSLVGTYTSEGTINFAVKSTDSAIIFYEARAAQVDFSKLNANNQLIGATLKYISEGSIVTSLGTGDFPQSSGGYPTDYRDFVSTIRLGYYSLKGQTFVLTNEISFDASSVHTRNLSFKEKIDFQIWNDTSDSAELVKPKIGDYINQSSLGAISATSFADNTKLSVQACQLSSQKLTIVVNNFDPNIICFAFLGSILEKSKELFIAAFGGMDAGSDPKFLYSHDFNLIGRPIIR